MIIGKISGDDINDPEIEEQLIGKDEEEISLLNDFADLSTYQPGFLHNNDFGDKLITKITSHQLTNTISDLKMIANSVSETPEEENEEEPGDFLSRKKSPTDNVQDYLEIINDVEESDPIKKEEHTQNTVKTF